MTAGDMARYGATWRDMARYGAIWRDMARYGAIPPIAPSCAMVDDDEILAAISRRAAGASVSDLVADLPGSSRRTLQRRLQALVEQGQIAAEGAARARRYRRAGSTIEALRRVASTDARIPLSAEANKALRLIRRPLKERAAVSYRRAFLDRYRPNRDSYLSVQARRRLHEEGRSAVPDRPAGTYARQIMSRLVIDLPWNSSRLEGNTYSLLETERLVKEGEVAEGKSARDAQMILNHKAAIEFLVDGAADIAFNRHTVLGLHALLSENLLADPAAGGRLRAIPVGIGGTSYRPPDVPQLVEDCFDALLRKAQAIRDPFEQAFFCMVHIPYLQPFEDVNKRVSRLAANIPFVRQNLCPLSFVDVPDDAYVEGTLAVYELNSVDLLRDVFLWAYSRSCARYAAVRHSLGEPDPFRLRHRAAIAEMVALVVRDRLGKKAAASRIQERATALPTGDRSRFVEVVETELLSLHEGNIARYRLRPSELAAWRRVWR